MILVWAIIKFERGICTYETSKMVFTQLLFPAKITVTFIIILFCFLSLGKGTIFFLSFWETNKPSCWMNGCRDARSERDRAMTRLRIKEQVFSFQEFLFHPADPLGITSREVYRECQPSYDVFRRSGAKGCSDHGFHAPLDLHYPIGNFASTQSQQRV